jgi:hypothetical protein
VHRAALFAANLWMRHDVTPAIAPRIQVNTSGSAPLVVRDAATGNANGGIRLPQIAVPVATLTGTTPLAFLHSNLGCALLGATDPWDGDSDAWDGQAGEDPSPTPEPVLQSLYGSRANYLVQYGIATAESVATRYVRPADMAAVLDEAIKAQVP